MLMAAPEPLSISQVSCSSTRLLAGHLHFPPLSEALASDNLARLPRQPPPSLQYLCPSHPMSLALSVSLDWSPTQATYGASEETGSGAGDWSLRCSGCGHQQAHDLETTAGSPLPQSCCSGLCSSLPAPLAVQSEDKGGIQALRATFLTLPGQSLLIEKWAPSLPHSSVRCERCVGHHKQ